MPLLLEQLYFTSAIASCQRAEDEPEHRKQRDVHDGKRKREWLSLECIDQTTCGLTSFLNGSRIH